LVETGYLHNHARMWFASIWVHTLELPWELGADFFMRNLLDGDPASNTLSWRWVCGLHTAGKTYLARADNIVKYTEGRFHPTRLASYARALGHPDHPKPMPLSVPNAIEPSKPTGILLHDDDFGLSHLLDAAPKNIHAAAYMPSLAGVSPWHVSDTVQSFVDGLRKECLTRYADRLPSITDTGTVDEVIAWAKRADVEQIIVPTPTVGPMRANLDKITAQLSAAGIQTCEIRAPYDTLCWPKATHGFFRFKENIPKFIETLHLK
jgi:deoxyribodipyrimidine photo-lyase